MNNTLSFITSFKTQTHQSKRHKQTTSNANKVTKSLELQEKSKKAKQKLNQLAQTAVINDIVSPTAEDWNARA